MSIEKSKTRINTGLVRLSYCHLWEPHAIEAGEKEKYSVCVLIPKSDEKTIEDIEAAVEAAKLLGAASWGGKIPATLKLPLRDGDVDKPDDPAYEDMFFFNCSSLEQPGIVNLSLQKILDRKEVYSGAWGRVSVNFYPYNTSGNKGIAVGLNNVQKVKDDDPLAGGAAAETDFDDGYVYEEDPDMM